MGFIASPDASGSKEPRLERVALGKTGLVASRLAMGTVELGMDYGIAVPGDFGRPPDAVAARLLRRALDAGVRLFDTAPGYGRSESLLGSVLGGSPEAIFATKVSVPQEGRPAERREAILQSIDASRRRLDREQLDIVQLHNATAELLEDESVMKALHQARDNGAVRALGASVYDESAALAAIATGVDVLQVAVNLLDQRMMATVIPRALQAGIGLLVRSVFMRGVLTAKAEWLPARLKPLGDAAQRARDALGLNWEDLTATALRFCLSLPIHCAIVGIRTEGELRAAARAAAAGPLPSGMLARVRGLALDDASLLDPRTW